MKKCFVFLLGIMLAVSSCIFAVKQIDKKEEKIVFASTADGKNFVLVGNTFYIKNNEGFELFLEQMKQGEDVDPDYKYVLENNISYTRNTNSVPEPIEKFYGTFDGNGYTISGLSMFCKYNYGTIMNTEFVGLSTKLVDGSSNSRPYAVYNHNYMFGGEPNTVKYYAVGGIAGVNMKGAKIYYCGVVDSTIRLTLNYSEYEANGTNTYMRWDDIHYSCVGGLVGINFGYIAASYSNGNKITARNYNDIMYSNTKDALNKDTNYPTKANKGYVTQSCAGGIVGYMGGMADQSMNNMTYSHINQSFAVNNTLFARGFQGWEQEFEKLMALNNISLQTTTYGTGGIIGASFYDWFSQGMPYLLTARAWLVNRCYSDYNYQDVVGASLIGYLYNQIAWFDKNVDGESDFPDTVFVNAYGASWRFYVNKNYGPKSVTIGNPIIESLTSNNLIPANEHAHVWADKLFPPIDILERIGEIDCKNVFYYPPDKSDHGGYPYLMLNAPITIYYYKDDNARLKGDKGYSTYTTSWGSLYDLSVKGTIGSTFSELDNLKSYEDSGVIKYLRGYSIYKDNTNTALTYNGEDSFILEDWYNRSKASNYGKLYPVYKEKTVKLNIKLNAHVGAETLPTVSVTDTGMLAGKSIGKTSLSGTNLKYTVEYPLKTFKYNRGAFHEDIVDRFQTTFDIKITSTYDEFDHDWYIVSAKTKSAQGKTYSGVDFDSKYSDMPRVNYWYDDETGYESAYIEKHIGGVSGIQANVNFQDVASFKENVIEVDYEVHVYKKVEIKVFESLKDYSTGESKRAKLTLYTYEGAGDSRWTLPFFFWAEDTSKNVTDPKRYEGYEDYGYTSSRGIFKTYGDVYPKKYTSGIFYNSGYDESLVFKNDFTINDESGEGNALFNSELQFVGYSYQLPDEYPCIKLYGKPMETTGTHKITIEPKKIGATLGKVSDYSYTISNIRFVIGGKEYGINRYGGGSDIPLFECGDLTNGGLKTTFNNKLEMIITFPDVDSDGKFLFGINADGNSLFVGQKELEINGLPPIDTITEIKFNLDVVLSVDKSNKIENGKRYFFINNSKEKQFSSKLIENKAIFNPEYDNDYEDGTYIIDTRENRQKEYTTETGGEDYRYSGTSGTSARVPNTDILSKRWTFDEADSELVDGIIHSKTEYLYVAELTKLTLDNSGVGEQNETMYVVNGTDVYTQTDIPSAVKYYVYDTSKGKFNNQFPPVFKIKNGKIYEYYEHSDSETPQFYYEGCFYYDYPNVTLLARSYTFYYVPISNTGFEDVDGESLDISYSNSTDWELVTITGPQRGTYERKTYGRKLGTINRELPEALKDRSKFVFVGWLFTTTRNAPEFTEDVTIRASSNDSKNFENNISFYNDLDPDVDVYYIHEIWKEATADSASLVYNIHIYKDGVDSGEVKYVTVNYKYNEALKIYDPVASSASISAPTISGYKFSGWMSITSSVSVYGLVANSGNSLVVKSITEAKYRDAQSKDLGIVAFYTKEVKFETEITIPLIITKILNGKSIGQETKVVNYTLNNYYYIPNITTISPPSVSGATFAGWADSSYTNKLSVGYSISSNYKTLTIKKIFAGEIGGIPDAFYVNAQYYNDNQNNFKLKFNYYKVGGSTALSTEYVTFKPSMFGLVDSGGSYKRFTSADGDKGFPALKMLNGRMSKFVSLAVSNSPTYASKKAFITTNNKGENLTINYFVFNSDETEIYSLTDHLNSSNVVCGDNGNVCEINVYYEDFYGLNLTYVYIDRTSGTELGRVDCMYQPGAKYTIGETDVPSELSPSYEFEPRILAVTYPDGKSASSLHYVISKYGSYADGVGSDGETIWSNGWEITVNNPLDNYYEEEIYVYYIDEYDLNYYRATIEIINIDENSKEMNRQEINFNYWVYPDYNENNEYIGKRLTPDDIERYTFDHWTKVGEAYFDRNTDEIVIINETGKTATIADISKFREFFGNIKVTLYAHYVKVPAKTVNVTVNINTTDVYGKTATKTNTYTLHDEAGTNTTKDWYTGSTIAFEDIKDYSYIDFMSTDAIFTMSDDGKTLTIGSINFPTQDVTININYQQNSAKIVIHYRDTNGETLKNAVNSNGEVGTEDVTYIFNYLTGGYGVNLQDKIVTNMTNYKFLGFNNLKYDGYNASYGTFLVETSNGSYKNYTTVSSKPTNTKGCHLIELDAVFKSPSSQLKIYYYDTNQSKIKDTANYNFYYTTGKQTTENIYLGNTIIAPSIANYAFEKWWTVDTNIFEPKSLTSTNLKVKDSYNGSEYPNEITVIATYKVETVKITVVSQVDGKEESSEEYTYWFNKKATASGKNLYVGNTLTAEEKDGYSFVWDLNGNSDYFETYSSGYTLKLKEPSSSTKPTDITIYKKYMASCTVTVNIKVVQGSTEKSIEKEAKNATFTFYYKSSTARENGYVLGQSVKLSDLKLEFKNAYYNANAKYKQGSSGNTQVTINATVDTTSVAGTSIILPKKVSGSVKDFAINLEYSINRTDVKYIINETIKQGTTISKSETKTLDYISSNYAGQTLVGTKAGCTIKSVDFKLKQGKSDWTQLLNQSTYKTTKPTTCSGYYEIEINITYEANAITVKFEYVSNATSLGTETKYIFYNGYIGTGDTITTGKVSQKSFANYEFISWSVSGDNATTVFSLSNDNTVLTLNDNFTGMSGNKEITVIANYKSTASVNVIQLIKIDGKLKVTITDSYYYTESSYDAPNSIGYGYTFVADDVYGTYYSFVNWQVEDSSASGYVTIDGKNVTLNKLDTTPTDFTIIANYKSFTVNIEISHSYLTGYKETENSPISQRTTKNATVLTYHYRVGIFDSTSDTSFFNGLTFNIFTTINGETYYFHEWLVFYNDNGIVSISGNTAKVVKKDADCGTGKTIKLFADYDIDYAEITFNNNLGETNILNTVKYKYKTDTTSKTFEAPTKNKYEFLYWTIECPTRKDYRNLFNLAGTDGKYTIVSTKTTVSDCNYIYAITLTANYRSTDEDVCTITVNHDYAGDIQSQTYTFHYRESGTANNIELYLGNSITAPDKAGFTFTGWTIDSGNEFFEGISDKVITLKKSPVALEGKKEATITAHYTANIVTVNVLFRQDDKDLSEKVKDIPKTYTFHYDLKMASLNNFNWNGGTLVSAGAYGFNRKALLGANEIDTNIYLGGSIVAPNIAGYNFVNWTIEGDDKSYVSANNNTVNFVDTTQGKPDNSIITLTANYDIDNTNCIITVVGYNHPDSVDKNAKESKDVDLTFYYKRDYGTETEYCLGATLDIEKIQSSFGFSKTTGLAFVKWILIDKNTGEDNSKYFSNVDLTSSKLQLAESVGNSIDSFVIEAHFTYTGVYRATFEIYKQYFENKAEATEELVETITFNFANATGGIGYGEIVYDKSKFGNSFNNWKTPVLESGADDWEKLWEYIDKQNTNSGIKTCSAKPDMKQEEYVIKLVAMLNIDKAVITVNYVDKKNSNTIAGQDSQSYIIYYNNSPRLDDTEKRPTLLKDSQLEATNIADYRFIDWMCSHPAYSQLLTKSGNTLTVKDLSKLDMSGLQNVEINAEYWPNEIITINVVTRYDGIAQSTEEKYYFYYSGANLPSGDGILHVGDTITATTKKGYMFSGWVLGDGSKYFEDYVAGGLVIKTKAPNESGSKEVTIYKDYEPNVLEITYEHYYQTETGNYTLDDTATSTLKFDYDDTKELILVSGTNYTTKISEGVYTLDCADEYNKKTYHWVETKIDNSATLDKFFTMTSDKIRTKLPTDVSGRHSIVISRYYNINELYLTVQSKVGETTRTMPLEKNPFILLENGRYLYNYDNKASYTFPTNINTAKETYRFVGWTIVKTVGKDNYEKLFAIERNTVGDAGKISGIGLSSTNTECDGVYAVTLTAEFERIDNLCTITLNYMDGNETISLGDNYIKSYNFYYDTLGSANGSNVYLSNVLTAPSIVGYTFKEWRIVESKQFFSFVEKEGESDYPYTVSSNQLTLVDTQPKQNGGELYYTGLQTAVIEAVYEKNTVNITVKYLDEKTEKEIANEQSYKFYYGLSGISDNADLYLGASIEALQIENYGFSSWTIESGDSKFVLDHSTSVLQLVEECPKDAQGNVYTGGYVLVLVAKYTEQACNINISYLDNQGNDLSEVETKLTTSYKFFYTQKAMLGENTAYLSSTIEAPARKGYTFTGWIVSDNDKKYFTNNEPLQSFSNIKLTIVSSLLAEDYPTGDINIEARYVEDVCKITIQFVDEEGTTIKANEIINYYYHDTIKTDGLKYDSTNADKNIIAVRSIENYNFIEWDNACNLLEIIAGKLYLKEIDNTFSGEYLGNVIAKYKSHGSYYINVNLDYIHWEEEYYKGNSSKLNGDNPTQFKYYYYTNKLVDSEGKEITYSKLTQELVNSKVNSEAQGYTFYCWKEMPTAKLVAGLNNTDLYSLSDSQIFSIIDQTKVESISLTQNNDPSEYLISMTGFKTLTMTNAKINAEIRTLLDNQNNLTIDLVAYYSKEIVIKEQEAQETTQEEQINNIPVNYIVDNTNFGGKIEKEFNYKLSATVIYTFKSQLQLFSNLMDGSKLLISEGEPFDYRLDSFKLDVGKIKTDRAVLDTSGKPSVYDFVNQEGYLTYTPNNYTYDGLSQHESHINAGWAMSIPTPTLYFTSPNVLTTENISDASLNAYIQDFVYRSTWNGENGTQFNYAFNLYIQWKGNGYTISIDTKINGVQNAYYNAVSGSVGTPIYWFDGTPVTNSGYLEEMTKRYGKVDGFVISKLENGTEIFDIGGKQLKVGDKINVIYANSHGDFSIEPNISEYTELTVKLDYHASTVGVGTLESVYNVVAEKTVNNIFELKDKYLYNQELKLGQYLKSAYQDPNPLTITYNKTKYYLAGWTLSNIGFNPENWSNVDKNSYRNLIQNLLGNDSTVEFRRNTINYNGASAEFMQSKIMAYDTSGFKCVYGDANGNITLHAVWLPYYSINLYNEASINNTTVHADIFNGNEIVLDSDATDNKISISYALTLQKQSIAIDYDITTSYGKKPSSVGYSLSFYKYILSAYTITDGKYYYGSTNGMNAWNITTSQFKNFINVYNTTYSSLDVKEMFNLYINRYLSQNKLPNMEINIYPVVENATIRVNVVNKNRGEETTVTNTINLQGIYKLNSLAIDNYSVDYLMSSSNKKIKYLNGIDFVKFLDTKAVIESGFGQNVADDVQVIVQNNRQILSLTLNAYYAGRLYFLKIQSKDGYVNAPFDDVNLRCESAISLDNLQAYKIISLNGKIKITTNTFATISQGFAFDKVSAINNSNIFYDYTDIYDQCINQIITDGNDFYLALAYGEKLYGDDKNTLLSKISRIDGSILEYYLYSNQAIDTVSVDKARDDSYDIRFDAFNKRYFSPKNYANVPNVLDYWTFDGETTISAVWKKKNYHIDLSVGLLNGVISYSNNAYLVAKVEAVKGVTYYVVNYELDPSSKLYVFNMYTMTEKQFNSKDRWYGGWDSLGLTKTATTRITVDATSVLTVWVYDQSKDTEDNLVGYRLAQVEIKNPNETSTTVCPVGKDSVISFVKVPGEAGQQYISTNGYTTVMSFADVDLENNANIKYQAVLEYITYSLTAETNKSAGMINGRSESGEFSTEKYVYTNLKVGSIIRVTFKPILGYGLAKWTLNEHDVGTDYTYFATIDACFLKQYIYNGQTTFSTSYESGQTAQNIGKLFAHDQLLEFDLKVSIYDENNTLLESYTLNENPNSILSLSMFDGGVSNDVKVLKVSNDKYILSIQANQNNGYKCYTINGQDYAILSMSLTGKAKEYINQTYVFPTNNFAQAEFNFNPDMLSDTVSFAIGEVISAENRVINIKLYVATIFEIKADDNAEFEKLVIKGDYNNGTRKLLAGNVEIANADSGSALQNSGKSYYAYNGQTILLKLVADKNYYTGGNIYISGEELPHEVGLEEEIELLVDSKKIVKANFNLVTINYNVSISYKGQTYTADTQESNPYSYKKIKDANDKQMLNKFPSVSITDPNGQVRTSNIVYGDTFNFEFNDTYFNSLTDGKLQDYSYNIYFNKVRQALTVDGKYSWTFAGDIDVQVEIVPMSGAVSVLTNIQDASELIAVDNRGRTMLISNGTVVFDLLPGDNLTIYAKDNNGYNYLGVSKNDGECSYVLRGNGSGDYDGYAKINLIDNYDSTKSGKYEIVYGYKTIKAKFVYMIEGDECTNPEDMPGAGYYTDKEGYTIIDTMSIYKPANGGENAGYRFIGYSIGNSNSNAIVDDGNEQVSIQINEYMSYLIETTEEIFKEFELKVYVHFIRQYTVKVELDGEDFGQTNVRLSYENGNLITQSNSQQAMPLTSIYLDTSAYSQEKFVLTVSSRDTRNYYLTLVENDTEIEPGDSYICQFISGTELVYEGKYTFNLDRNYVFKLKYMPRQYTETVSSYLIKDMETLENYRNDLTYPLEEMTESPQVTIEIKSDNNSLKNRYGTKNTITITIGEVYDEAREMYYTDYALEHLKLDGVVQQVTEKITESNGKKYVYEFTYDVTHDTNICIVFKRVYGVSVGVKK